MKNEQVKSGNEETTKSAKRPTLGTDLICTTVRSDKLCQIDLFVAECTKSDYLEGNVSGIEHVFPKNEFDCSIFLPHKLGNRGGSRVFFACNLYISM